MKQGMSCLMWALVAVALWAVCGGGFVAAVMAR